MYIASQKKGGENCDDNIGKKTEMKRIEKKSKNRNEESKRRNTFLKRIRDM